MASRIRQTAKPSYRSILRIESLERRYVLSASVGLMGATVVDMAKPLVVADCDSVNSNPAMRLPSEMVVNTTVDLPTTEVRMPVSNLPEVTIQRSDHPFPPISIATEDIVRMPEKSSIPEGTIQLLDRPFPPIYANATPNLSASSSDAYTDSFVSTGLPQAPDRASVQLALAGDQGRIRFAVPRRLPLSASVPIATLPSKEVSHSVVTNAGNSGLIVEPHVVLPVGLKSGSSSVIEYQSNQGNFAKKDQNEPLRPPIHTAAARDIAFMELTSRALKVKPFGRQIGITV